MNKPVVGQVVLYHSDKWEHPVAAIVTDVFEKEHADGVTRVACHDEVRLSIFTPEGFNHPSYGWVGRDSTLVGSLGYWTEKA